MKKFTSIFISILMMLSMIIASPSVFAADTDYILSEDASSYAIIKFVDQNDESIGMRYCDEYSIPEEGIFKSSNGYMYGAKSVKFIVQAKEGITIKILHVR